MPDAIAPATMNHPETSRRREDIAHTIRRLLKGIAGLKPQDIDAHTNWFTLGLDSLLVVQLVQALSREYPAVPLVVGEVYESGDTLHRLAAFIDSRLPAEDPTPRAVPSPVTGATLPAAPPVGQGIAAVLARQIEAMNGLFTQQLETLRAVAGRGAVAVPPPSAIQPAPPPDPV
ncbi:MAG TPA: phosphopantetheine-binding protein, partial [Azospirillaceae bacterium]|nr:phosphopantetheine-binding protein [Azospirillaceae bacterium]